VVRKPKKETIRLIDIELPQIIKVQVYMARIECIESNHMTLIMKIIGG